MSLSVNLYAVQLVVQMFEGFMLIQACKTYKWDSFVRENIQLLLLREFYFLHTHVQSINVKTISCFKCEQFITKFHKTYIMKKKLNTCKCYKLIQLVEFLSLDKPERHLSLNYGI